MPDMLLVIQYEQFFNTGEDADLPEAMRDGLEALRQYGGARVVGCYETEGGKEWLAKALNSITVKTPITIRVD